MDMRAWGWALIIFGAAGLIMSFIIYLVEGLEDIRAIEIYGWTGLLILSTGSEFVRRYPAH
jgi:hypothetical protein